VTWSGFLAVFCVLLFFCVVWYGLSYLLTPHMDDPDGWAKITGNCGDTMEIGIKVEHGKVVETHCSTDGCTMSRQCIESAARLAGDKNIKEIRSLNMTHIAEEVGRIPDSHLHCAQLAEITLQRALDDYISNQQPAG
jgi:nitrogen fixation NifU-like protein